MPNNTLVRIDEIIVKDEDLIKALDNDYAVETYSPELSVERGKYSFNIQPMQVITRDFSGEQTLPNLQIDIFMHYDMDGDDKWSQAWTTFMTKANAVLQALYTKQNLVNGVSTVSINISFDNPIVEKERMISLTFNCEYKIFASR